MSRIPLNIPLGNMSPEALDLETQVLFERLEEKGFDVRLTDHFLESPEERAFMESFLTEEQLYLSGMLQR